MKIAELLIALVVIVVVLVIFVLVFRGESVTDFMKRKPKNEKQEKTVKKPLQAARRFAAMQQYQVISPARLAKNGVFADIDFIVVCVFGLLCVKCIGLGGEIRAVSNCEKRVKEAARLGFRSCIIPKHNIKSLTDSTKQLINVYGAKNIRDAYNEASN